MVRTVSILSFLHLLLLVYCDLTIPLRSSPPKPPSGEEITDKVFSHGANLNTFPLAYGDMSGDKLTDVVTLSRNRSTLLIFLAYHKPPYMREGPSLNLSSHFLEKGEAVSSVLLGDFSGDGLLDLAVVSRHLKVKSVNLPQESCREIENQTNSSKVHPASVNIIYWATKVTFCLGDGKGVSLSCQKPRWPHYLNDLVSEPMGLDVNRDMMVDLVGEYWEIEWEGNVSIDEYWVCNKVPVLVKKKGAWISEEGSPASLFQSEETLGFNETINSTWTWLNPTSNFFADVNDDQIPEFVVMAIHHNMSNLSSSQGDHTYRKVYSVIYTNNDASHTLTFLPWDTDGDKVDLVEVLGQPLILDLERSGSLLHLVPYCEAKGCSSAWGLMAKVNETGFVKMALGPLTHDGEDWDPVPPVHYQEPNSSLIPPHGYDSESHVEIEDWLYARSIGFSVGDYNLDGYPDLISVLQSRKTKRRRAVVFENVPTSSSDGKLSREFKPNFDFLKEYENISSASFFDFKENGIVDVLLIQKNLFVNESNNVHNFTYTLRAIEVNPNVDSYFIKVMALSGRPCPSCPGEKNVPYGNLVSGAQVQYRFKDLDGKVQTAISTQSYRSGLATLDLPYTIFGIGHIPNFIESLSIYLGYTFSINSSRVFSHTSHQIIPNSQIIAIPSYPIPTEPKKDLHWTVKLFLTPGDAVLHTFLVLIGIVSFVATLASLLEYKERRVDRKERLAEAQKFLM